MIRGVKSKPKHSRLGQILYEINFSKELKGFFQLVPARKRTSKFVVVIKLRRAQMGLLIIDHPITFDNEVGSMSLLSALFPV